MTGSGPLALPGAFVGLLTASGALLMLLAATDRRPMAKTRRRRLRRLLDTAGSPSTSVATLTAASAGLGLGGAAAMLLVTAVPAVALLSGVAAGALPFAVLARRAERRRRASAAAWPEAIDSLVSAVRAGLPLPEAVADLSRRGPEPLRPAFAGFEADYRALGAFGPALDASALRLADPVADRVVACLHVAREVGGTDLGRVLASLATLVRDDGRTRREIEARQSWTVSAARVAVAAPWLTLALLCLRPEAVRAYSSPEGAVLLVGAAAVSLVAYALMTRIARLPPEPRLRP
ncbi:MAG: type II secretion system F family protein [Actinomycetota bacterium]|nr:type II secretion system F family protein [Actinomycetota bacterium]